MNNPKIIKIMYGIIDYLYESKKEFVESIEDGKELAK